MRPFKKRSTRVDPEKLTLKAEESLRHTRGQQERVNIITAWLKKREDQNDFGRDFEFTFNQKEAS